MNVETIQVGSVLCASDMEATTSCVVIYIKHLETGRPSGLELTVRWLNANGGRKQGEISTHPFEAFEQSEFENVSVIQSII